MQCMKCGRDTEAEQVFCENCREIMAKYPVKPGIVVQLPYRFPQTQKKQTARRRTSLSAEEQIRWLRRLSVLQTALIALLLAAVILLSRLSFTLHQESEKKVLPGQNYITATEAPETEPEPTTVPEADIAG